MNALHPSAAVFPVLLTIGLLVAPSIEQAARGGERSVSAERPLVVVDGEPITEADLDFAMLSRRVPSELRKQARRRVLEQLVDARLMRAWLAERNAEPDPRQLDEEVERIKALIRRTGDEPDEILGRLGYTDETLRRELALPLAWRIHARRMITPQRLRDYFRERREQFDGTQVRAAHILIKVPAESDEEAWKAAERKLRQVRDEIVADRLTFAEAAQRHSEAPSRDEGGDVGFFAYRGTMPEAFSAAVFPLETGEVSEPFRTPFGVHVAVVTERKAGDLSLEDVRRSVFDRLQRELWDELVEERRAAARIEWREEVMSDE
jgi:parvulin-like peptidyl-prolyl isomerase